MKRISLILLTVFALHAEEEQPPITYWSIHPLHVGVNGVILGKADLTDTPLGGHLQFTKANAFIDLLIPFTRKTFLFPRYEWNTFTMNWDKNPKFNTTQFYYSQFSLTLYTTELEKWRWIMRAQYNLDNKHFHDPIKYGLFSALFWGAYEIHPKWHYHVGALGYGGMRGEQVYPIIGADYSPNDKWTILVVFPMEYYVMYKFNQRWSLSLKANPIKERFRAGRDQPQPMSIFSYSSTGAALNLHYEIFRRFEFDLYGGWNFGGNFYIKNRRGHKPLYADVGSAPYGGLSLNWGI